MLKINDGICEKRKGKGWDGEEERKEDKEKEKFLKCQRAVRYKK